MYQNHFQLAERPFNLRPDPSYLYLGERHRMALAMLEYGLFEQDGYAVITGDVGSGKTTLVRHLLRALDNEYQIGLITNTHKSFGDLLHWVTAAFGIERAGRTDAELHQAFVDYLVSVYERGQQTLLIIDEAQNLDPGSLEEVRVLSNINADASNVMQLLLVGQPELRELLRHPSLTQVAQRISTHYHLAPLAADDVGDYIRHRLQVAGAQRPLFTQPAIQMIAAASGGVPRLINQISETCLVYAFGANSQVVNSHTVNDVLNDRRASQILPLHRAQVAGTTLNPNTNMGRK